MSTSSSEPQTLSARAKSPRAPTARRISGAAPSQRGAPLTARRPSAPPASPAVAHARWLAAQQRGDSLTSVAAIASALQAPSPTSGVIGGSGLEEKLMGAALTSPVVGGLGFDGEGTPDALPRAMMVSPVTLSASSPDISPPVRVLSSPSPPPPSVASTSRSTPVVVVAVAPGQKRTSPAMPIAAPPTNRAVSAVLAAWEMSPGYHSDSPTSTPHGMMDETDSPYWTAKTFTPSAVPRRTVFNSDYERLVGLVGDVKGAVKNLQLYCSGFLDLAARPHDANHVYAQLDGMEGALRHLLDLESAVRATGERYIKRLDASGGGGGRACTVEDQEPTVRVLLDAVEKICAAVPLLADHAQPIANSVHDIAGTSSVMLRNMLWRQMATEVTHVHRLASHLSIAMAPVIDSEM